MNTKNLTGCLFSNMIQNGAAELFSNRKTVNDLNVFPIPDGDTGDNMYMTVNGGANSVETDTSDNLGTVSAMIANGMFMGARGNSGVILSRIFAGIANGLAGIKEADIETFCNAMNIGITEAYNSVSHPVEGTILTVFKDGVNRANSSVDSSYSFETYFKVLITEMQKSLENTPDLLPVLKENGVVDSGGAGLVFIFNGMAEGLNGRKISKDEKTETVNEPDYSLFNENSELSYGYCTEFMLQLMTSKVGDVSRFDEKEIFDYINSVGESVVAFRNESVIKVHVHTKTPGEILSHCQKWGEFLKVKVENMTLQHNETFVDRTSVKLRKKVHKPVATVTVASGEGIAETFADLGVDAIVDGGQSMNPSVQDFIEAFNSIDADRIIVFPNNGNIILTAQQAASIYTKAEITVIKSRTIGEAYAAISGVDLTGGDFKETVAAVNDCISGTVTGMVSKANRDTVQNGVSVRNGHYISFDSNDVIYSDSESRIEVTEGLASSLDAGNFDIMLLISGRDVPQEEADILSAKLTEKYKMTEVIHINGMQPVYDYILVLE